MISLSSIAEKPRRGVYNKLFTFFLLFFYWVRKQLTFRHPTSSFLSQPRSTVPRSGEWWTTSSPPFFLRDSRTNETRARVKITPRVSPFSRGVIFTCSRVSLVLLSLRKKWGTTRSLGEWQIISMKFLWSFLRCFFAGKPVG